MRHGGSPTKAQPAPPSGVLLGWTTSRNQRPANQEIPVTVEGQPENPIVVSAEEIMSDMSPGENGAEHTSVNLVREGETCTTITVRPMPIPFVKTMDSISDSEVSTWLRRPVLVRTGPIPTTVGTSFFEVPLRAVDILTSSGIWQRKLSNYQGIRCTFCFTFEVSCTPFHAGIVRLAYIPQVQAPRYNEGQEYNRSNSRQTLFTAPGHTLNLQDQTSVCVKIPWSSPVPYADISDSAVSNVTGANGDFYGMMLTDCTPAAGTVSPTWVLYLHLEDVEFVGRSASGFSGTAPQMGLAEDLSSSKAISTTLKAASTASKALAKGFRSVPVLPSAFDTFGKVARITANAASFFGFSKPIVSTPHVRTTRMRDAFLFNDTGSDPVVNTLTSHDTGQPVCPVFGTNVDEMAIDFVAQVPGLVGDFTVTTQTSETLVYAAHLSPSSLFFQGARTLFPWLEYGESQANAPFRSIHPAPAFVCAAMAYQWRGSFKFKFYLSKTKFHTGRLVFVYNPTVQDANYNAVRTGGSYLYPLYGEVEGCLRKEVDIRGLSEVEFEIPYTNVMHTLPFTGSMGQLLVYVIDPVRQPATVPTGMRVLVSASMPGLAVYGSPGVGFQPTTNVLNVLAQAGSVVEVEPQSGLEQHLPDRIVSLLSWLKKPMFFPVSSTLFIDRFKTTVPTYTPNVINPTAMVVARPDAYNLLASGYAFKRGGLVIRTKRLSSNTSNDASSLKTLNGTRSSAAPGTSSGIITLAVSNQQTFNSPEERTLSSYISEQFPGACTRVAITPNPAVSFTNSRERQFGQSTLTVTEDIVNGALVTHEAARVAADDFMLGYFIGFPTIVPMREINASG